MEKNVTILVPGQGEERRFVDRVLLPGTTTTEAIRDAGISNPSHYVLEDENGRVFVQGENLYQQVEPGAKLFLIPDEARVGS